MAAGRIWTQREIDFVKAHYRKMATEQIARRLRRSVNSVWQRAAILGLAARNRRLGEPWETTLRKLHAQGYTDAEIAERVGMSRKGLGERRRKLGLPSNAYSERRREAVRKNTRAQLRKSCVSSLAELRTLVFRRRAQEAGWPDDLRPRSVQILNALWDRGPMTRREIAAAIGLPWRGSRASLKSNDPEGTYLAHLIRRGLVVSLGRAAKGKGRGGSSQVYCLPLWIERNQHMNQGA